MDRSNSVKISAERPMNRPEQMTDGVEPIEIPVGRDTGDPPVCAMDPREIAAQSFALTDCISMVTMRKEGITEILTHDDHFTQEVFTRLL
jgi:hypothetical protein